MRCAVIYSSVTGNTRQVAGAVLRALPPGTEIFPVRDAPGPDGYDFLALGFWVYRAAPDPKMLAYMRRVRGKTVGLFGTLAAWPDSEHARKVLANAAGALEGNRLGPSFLCQGKFSPRRLEQRQKDILAGRRKGHPMTPERQARLAEAANHPDAGDLQRAEALFSAYFSTLAAAAE